MKNELMSLYQEALNVTYLVFQEPGNNHYLENARDLIGDVIRYATEHPESMNVFLNIFKHDYSNVSHAVNTLVLMVYLAIRMDITHEKTLMALGEGGLLHDIGKIRIPEQIINKNGDLSPPEWKLMKKHTEYGIDILEKNGRIDPVISSIVANHHEKPDGTGYPNGYTAEQLNIYVSMATVVDVYDAVSSNRPYSNARTPGGSIRFMRETRSNFDPEVLEKFIKMINDGDNK